MIRPAGKIQKVVCDICGNKTEKRICTCGGIYDIWTSAFKKATPESVKALPYFVLSDKEKVEWIAKLQQEESK